VIIAGCGHVSGPFARRRWPQALIFTDFTASFALIVVLLVIRFVAAHTIRRGTDAAHHLQRRWIATIRNFLFFQGLIGLVLIWASQLRTFAISLTAVAVVIVVATFETVVRCMSYQRPIWAYSVEKL
jgi:hypothetical protein